MHGEASAWWPPHLFRDGRPVVIGRAPGRLDVMGGIADYSGATVLELPLAQAALVAVQTADDGYLTVHTGGPAAPTLASPTVRVPVAALFEGPPEHTPDRLRAALAAAGGPWAAYLLGPLAVLQAAGRLPPLAGLRLSAWSDVPSGAGVSSSAALEVASLRAMQGLSGLELAPMEIVHLAQQAEHRVALAPCGIMDQAAATLGYKDHLLMLRCQPAEVLGHRPIPAGVHVLGIDSRVAHRVGGGQYGRVRTATFMGRAMIGRIDPADPPDGYLCNLSPENFLRRYATLLPQEMSGAEFLAAYGETGDEATQVDPGTMYRVRDCTSHPILEQANVESFLAALDHYEEGGDPAALEAAGEAMYRSHESYGARCGLGAPETDLLVRLVRERGPEHGLYGAKITGGGAGGTVAVLGAGPHALEAVAGVLAEYERESGHAGRIIAGSSDGAWKSPPQRVMPETVNE